MRLLKLEMKRVLKTRLTLVLLLLAIALSFLFAWLPTTFPYNSYTDAEGNQVKLTGMESIEYKKKLQADISGIVTPEKVRQAVEKYQACLKKYGAETSYDLPEGVYDAEILPYAPLLHGVREAYADPDTGIAPSIMEIAPERVNGFYDACRERIASLMRMEQKNHPAAQQKAIHLYDEVETPYSVFPGLDKDAMDYQVILSFFIMLFSAIIAAPIFTSDFQTGADDILRCTKYGRAKFAITKIVSVLLICAVTYCLCAGIFLIITNSLWGWECTKTSMQMLYSIVNLPNMNMGQLQCFTAFSGLLCLLATISFTLFLSSKFNNIAVSSSVALLFCILPIIVYMALPAQIGCLIYSILPSCGVSLQTSILYAAIDFDFWNIGSLAIWLPYVMLGACAIEIPLFTGLTVYSYSRR